MARLASCSPVAAACALELRTCSPCAAGDLLLLLLLHLVLRQLMGAVAATRVREMRHARADLAETVVMQEWKRKW